MLRLEHVDVCFGAGTPSRRLVLRNLDLQVHPAERVAVVGSNGAGKSTLFGVIAGTVLPRRGRITLGGTEISRWSTHRRARKIAWVMQNPSAGTMTRMTVAANMALAFRRGRGRHLVPWLSARRRALFRDWLALPGMGLETRLDDLAGHLSGGQRQALSLVMALMAQADLLLLDEVTSALDPESSAQVMAVISRLVPESGTACLMITHAPDQARSFATRTLELHQGCLREPG
jgi:putative ABC transport system ATP-binding protein